MAKIKGILRSSAKTLITLLLGMVIGLIIQPLTQFSLNKALYPPQIDLIANTQFNIYSDLPKSFRGQVIPVFGETSDYRIMANEAYGYDFIFPPFPSKNVTFEKGAINFKTFDLNKKEKNIITQNFFLINNGKGKIKNVRFRICYGYPVVNVTGILKSTIGDCVVAQSDVVLPVGDIYPPQESLGSVDLEVKDYFLDVNQIIKDIRIEYYWEVSIFEGWRGLDKNHFLHFGTIVTDASPEHPMVQKIYSIISGSG